MTYAMLFAAAYVCIWAWLDAPIRAALGISELSRRTGWES